MLHVNALNVPRPGGGDLLAIDEFDVEAGAHIGISGPSGAGKSTLLYALCGLVPDASGRAEWNGTDILALGREARARFRRDTLSIVFQDSLLIEELSAVENAATPAAFRPSRERAIIRARAAELLVELGVDDPARSIASFSGGERQRVAVARALAVPTPALLLDEPTASLDQATGDLLMDALLRITRETGTTLITVSHDAPVLGKMNKVITLRKGALSNEAWAA